ncbi:MAG: winged helix-turn-helix transcriptional regulator [Actinobacteria bacterium]|nr:winged helix-turn-helix transcriptional regulator [Actinomycetota bacterium]
MKDPPPPDAREPAPTAAAPTPRQWTFLTNHGHVLICLSRNPDARIRDVAAQVGITERAAQGILSELEADGYVTKVKRGRRNRYRIHREQTFRHPAEDSHPVGDLLEIFTTRK